MSNTIIDPQNIITSDADKYNFGDELIITHIKPYSTNPLNPLIINYFPDKEKVIRIILILSGEMEITVDYVKHNFSTNCLVEISPIVMVNNIEVSDNFSCYDILISTTFIEDTLLDKKPIPISHFMEMKTRPGTFLSADNANCLKKSILRMIHYLKIDFHHYRKELLHNTFYNLVLELGDIFINLEKEKNLTQAPLSRKDSFIREFILLLNKHGKEEHSPAFYSNKLCISTQYLSLLLKERSKKTTGDWIASFLITQAKIKLRSPGTSIQEASDFLNFSDQASFGKFFKKHTGITPKRYKEEYL